LFEADSLGDWLSSSTPDRPSLRGFLTVLVSSSTSWRREFARSDGGGRQLQVGWGEFRPPFIRGTLNQSMRALDNKKRLSWRG
jgi:hypothetical protein